VFVDDGMGQQQGNYTNELEEKVDLANKIASRYKDSKNYSLLFELNQTRDHPVTASKAIDGKHKNKEKQLTVKQFGKILTVLTEYGTDHNDIGIESKEELRKKLKSSSDAVDDSECPICFERPAEVALSTCTHAFCTTCIEQWQERSGTCPICRQNDDENEDPWVLTEKVPSDLGIFFSEYLDKL